MPLLGEAGKWGVFLEEDAAHVIPLEDLEPHFRTSECHCHPLRNPETLGTLVVHNSFDRREFFEQDFARPGRPN